VFGMPATIRVFVSVPPADLRKGYDGLARLARDVVEQDPLSGHLFVFANRKRDRIKILYWDRDGYAVWMKRLERGNFRWPAPASDHVEWTAAELAAVLGGIDLKATRKRPRYELAAS
jgi:transposase